MEIRLEIVLPLEVPGQVEGADELVLVHHISAQVAACTVVQVWLSDSMVAAIVAVAVVAVASVVAVAIAGAAGAAAIAVAVLGSVPKFIKKYGFDDHIYDYNYNQNMYDLYS